VAAIDPAGTTGAVSNPMTGNLRPRANRVKQLVAVAAYCLAAAVTELQTPRLTLHAIDTAEGERIAARRAGPEDVWADDFPFDGDVIGVTAFLRATSFHGDQGPFGHYRITRRTDGRAIGGIGFKGRPQDGCAEIGYGLAPSARGQGYAAEALSALLTVAAEHGVSRVVADTDPDNVASQRTLERAGFRAAGANGDLCLFEMRLDG
jgi:RimJ/RimL family protein N-acetyltransferase